MCNKDSLTYISFLLQPPVGVLRYLINGEIGELCSSLLFWNTILIAKSSLFYIVVCIFTVSAQGFEYDNLYIHFFMELPASKAAKT